MINQRIRQFRKEVRKGKKGKKKDPQSIITILLHTKKLIKQSLAHS